MIIWFSSHKRHQLAGGAFRSIIQIEPPSQEIPQDSAPQPGMAPPTLSTPARSLRQPPPLSRRGARLRTAVHVGSSRQPAQVSRRANRRLGQALPPAGQPPPPSRCRPLSVFTLPWARAGRSASRDLSSPLPATVRPSWQRRRMGLSWRRTTGRRRSCWKRWGAGSRARGAGRAEGSRLRPSPRRLRPALPLTLLPSAAPAPERRGPRVRVRGAGPAGAAAAGAPGPGAPGRRAPPRAAAARPQPGGEGDGGRRAQVSGKGGRGGASGPGGSASSLRLLCATHRRSTIASSVHLSLAARERLEPPRRPPPPFAEEGFELRPLSLPPVPASSPPPAQRPPLRA